MRLPEPELKYPKPKILMVDMPSICSETLQNAGYNVSVGSFGVPYPVPSSSSLFPVSLDTCTLPNCEEQELVMIDLAQPDATGQPPTEGPGNGVDALWQRATDGTIDPRPYAMSFVQGPFEQILQHGGIFVVFLAPYDVIEYEWGARDYDGIIRRVESRKRNSLSFLKSLESLTTKRQRGSEIEFDAKEPIARLLKRGAGSASYTCVLHSDWHWTTLAKNKYGQTVAASCVLEKPGGGILLLPHMPNVTTILLPLVEDFFTQWSPRLFPDHEGSRWLHRTEYEIPAVNRIRDEISHVKVDAGKRVRELDAEVEQIRSENSDWYAILNGTGDALVAAVIHSLKTIGFQRVIDVDKELKQQGKDRDLREDIQVQDQALVLIVDVKGITGCPEDAEATQSEKHALIRTREWGGKVKPLTIINHQRNMPPHDRNPEPYRKEIVENAHQTGLGLMTTWDIFRILRNKETLKWSNEVVMPIFYRTGRIKPIPEHYIEIGSIAHVWQRAFGVIPNQKISVGDRLAVEVGDLYEELVADSLQVDDNLVTEATANSNCGIAFDDASKHFRVGMKVFLVR